MLSKAMEQALNNQVKNELYSAYLYRQMGLHFKHANFNGFAAWMFMQSREEEMHAQKFIDHIIDRGGKVQLMQLDQPTDNWTSPLQIFEESLKHEQFITAEINKLVDLAHKEDDKPAHYMLGWFVAEQVEEESSVGEVVDKMKMIADKPTALFMYDAVLGRRGAAGGGGE